jgi:hypothetical protein
MVEKKVHPEEPIEFYFESDPKLGSGWRVVIPYNRKEKTIGLFDIARLTSTTVKLAEFDKEKRRRRLDIPRVTVGRNLALRIATYSAYKVKHAPATARRILRELV